MNLAHRQWLVRGGTNWRTRLTSTNRLLTTRLFEKKWSSCNKSIFQYSHKAITICNVSISSRIFALLFCHFILFCFPLAAESPNSCLCSVKLNQVKSNRSINEYRYNYYKIRIVEETTHKSNCSKKCQGFQQCLKRDYQRNI